MFYFIKSYNKKYPKNDEVDGDRGRDCGVYELKGIVVVDSYFLNCLSSLEKRSWFGHPSCYRLDHKNR